MNRTIKQISYAAAMDMGGFPIRQPLPAATLENIDPFLLLHHATVKVPTHIPVTKAGVGPHPHRGFSPVSFIFKGGVHHRDSRGNDNVIYAGGTQWMNAGMGIIHSERPPVDIHEIDGVQELIQLWVNTPAKHKMDQPAYQPLTSEDTPVWESADKKTKFNIIAGNFQGIKGPIYSLSNVNTFTATMQTGAKEFFPIPESHNAFIYLMEGQLKINGNQVLDALNLVNFELDGIGFELEALSDVRFFIGTGEPLNEPIAAHGPFVMNNQTEVMEAFRDYQLGKMGVLIEE
ncbi:MAG: nuclease PIN [Bacteroidetes bacterium 24-39-8]|jgi:redox-sensitive bicupin YhaK (pirin superfamily)|nr:MAG: nuclease PIN [Sphingobacteriia bacterium 35-40-8]OYZ52390.1 MAG: nuclease PIN [Bacteroidetes bacterium 24-39-8]OZA66657.1 MAG: nuclease PIN [Sphingobacteriia bacterium 39-39-8]HQR91746.1 pirin family protein [Sediminibacterium sp.]HQS53452.1 pirin family protein [Sediminibacterium sp.]